MKKQITLALIWALVVVGAAQADYDDHIRSQGVAPKEFTTREQPAYFGGDMVIGGNLVVKGYVVSTLTDTTP